MLLPKRIKPKKKSKPKIRSDNFLNITKEGCTAKEYREVLTAILRDDFYN